MAGTRPCIRLHGTEGIRTQVSQILGHHSDHYTVEMINGKSRIAQLEKHVAILEVDSLETLQLLAFCQPFTKCTHTSYHVSPCGNSASAL